MITHGFEVQPSQFQYIMFWGLEGTIPRSTSTSLICVANKGHAGECFERHAED